jgi:hypothetical protein
MLLLAVLEYCPRGGAPFCRRHKVQQVHQRIERFAASVFGVKAPIDIQRDIACPEGRQLGGEKILHCRNCILGRLTAAAADCAVEVRIKVP